jgi:hypothetical protein
MLYIASPSGYPTPEELGRQRPGRRSAAGFYRKLCRAGSTNLTGAAWYMLRFANRGHCCPENFSDRVLGLNLFGKALPD